MSVILKPSIQENGVFTVVPDARLNSGVLLCSKDSIRGENPDYARYQVSIPVQPHVFKVEELRLMAVTIDDKTYAANVLGEANVLVCHGYDILGWRTGLLGMNLRGLTIPRLVDSLEKEIGQVDLAIVCNPGAYDLNTFETMYTKGDGINGSVQLDVASNVLFASMDFQHNHAVPVVPQSLQEKIIKNNYLKR